MLSMCFLSTGMCVVPTASTHKQCVVIAAAGSFCCECSKLRFFFHVNLSVVVQQLPASVEIAAAACSWGHLPTSQLQLQ